jgi:hypothetical protein
MNPHRIYLNTEKCVRGLNVKRTECWEKIISWASLTIAGIYDLLIGAEIAQTELQQNSSVE